ncbi:hypothetical protein Tco_1159169 [Tanacetum coccineum]
MAFPRLQELAAAQHSSSLIDAMSVYIERKINDDLHFTAGLSHLWEVLYSRVNEHRLLIAELNVFGGPLALQCAEFFKQLSQTKVLKMLEIRKSIAKVHMQVHWRKKDDPLGCIFCCIMVHGDDEVCDLVLQLFASVWWIGEACFYYVYNPSTNEYKKLSYLDFSLDNLPYYSSARLKIAFDPTKSPHYKLVNAGGAFYDINIKFYSSETCKWSLCKDRFKYFIFDHFNSAIYWNDEVGQFGPNVWSIVLGEREQDLFLVINLSRKVVQYNLILNTLHEIYDCVSNQVNDNHDDDADDDDDDDDELLQQFQPEHNVYEFIPSYASV